MKTILALLSVALLSAGALQAKDAKPSTKPDAAPAAPATGDLHALMKSIGGDFGKLSKSISDPAQVEANIELAKQLAETAGKCADLTPPKGDAKAYKAEIAKLVEDFKKIETALGKKDFAAAKKAADACTGLKKQDHPKFIQRK